MSLRRLGVAWMVAAMTIAATLLILRFLGAATVTYAIVKGLQSGAVVATFFLTCFFVAQWVHEIRTRR